MLSNPSSEANPLILPSADPRLWVDRSLHARSSQMNAQLTCQCISVLLHGRQVTCQMYWSHLISSCVLQPLAGLSLEGSQSSAFKLATLLPYLGTKSMILWMLEKNFSPHSKSLNYWRFGFKSSMLHSKLIVFFFSHSLFFFPPIGIGTIYSQGGLSLQLINLSLACGLKRDTMPLSKARLAQRPMQNHHQILLEVENIS